MNGAVRVPYPSIGCAEKFGVHPGTLLAPLRPTQSTPGLLATAKSVPHGPDSNRFDSKHLNISRSGKKSETRRPAPRR